MQDQIQTSFLSSLDTFGIGVQKPAVSLAKDPRDRFIESAISEIHRIERAEEPKGNWYIKNEDGTYDITLRNGIAVLVVGGAPKRRVPDADTATAYLKAAIAACQAGELDALLEATQLKRKKR